MSTVFTASFLTLALAGIADAGYLVWKHYHNTTKPLVCPLDHDCSKVTESKWSTIFWVRNEVLGLLFYVSMLAAGLILFFVSGLVLVSLPLILLMKLAAGFGLIFSLSLKNSPYASGNMIHTQKQDLLYCTKNYILRNGIRFYL